MISIEFKAETDGIKRKGLRAKSKLPNKSLTFLHFALSPLPCVLRYNPRVPTKLDIQNWARRDLFEFFRKYDNPYFNVCTTLDITNLLAELKQQPDTSVSVAFHYLALQVANEIEPFRYRLHGDDVLVYEVINGGTIVLHPNESFNFAYFDYHDNFRKFVEGAQKSIEATKAGDGHLNPDADENRIHFTVLPWISFTSFAHARDFTRADSIPKIAFGKFYETGGKTFLPISVEVHHALMDGLHVGRYLARFQELLNEPQLFLD